jgi:hypothetical protein
VNELRGSCHCGRIQIVLRDAPIEASECNCSICRRTAGLWHYCSPDLVSVECLGVAYRQGDCALNLWHCGGWLHNPLDADRFRPPAHGRQSKDVRSRTFGQPAATNGRWSKLLAGSGFNVRSPPPQVVLRLQAQARSLEAEWQLLGRKAARRQSRIATILISGVERYLIAIDDK